MLILENAVLLDLETGHEHARRFVTLENESIVAVDENRPSGGAERIDLEGAPRAVLHSATAVNAEILGQGGRLGLIAPGAMADLIAVAGNPLGNLGLLQNQGRHLDLIMKGGVLFKCAL